MKIIFFSLGLAFIIGSFIIFSLIAVFNEYTWMDFNYHVIITSVGFIVLSLGILSMILFIREKNHHNQ